MVDIYKNIKYYNIVQISRFMVSHKMLPNSNRLEMTQISTV